MKVIKSYRLSTANMVLLCFFLFLCLFGFLCKLESLALTAWKILLFQTLMKKKISDSTTWSLAVDTKEECARSAVIPIYSDLVKGAPETIMRIFFCINIKC